MSDATITAPPPAASRAATPQNRRLVALWLFAVCIMIWVMVGIGGYTRDSGSGLSIMDWDPIMGTIPPLTQNAWNRLFALYQSIPQYRLLHPGMGLDGFKALFWPEYIHRLWGRLIGCVFFIPLVVLVLTRRVEARLIPWLALLFILGGLQGAIGWFMVASGFDPNSVAVQPWRLTLHFSAAMFLLVAVLWTALNILHPQPTRIAGAKTLKIATHIAATALLLTMFAGTFVSGTHAITVFNPATGAGMGAPPPGYPHLGFFSDKATILFNHQTLAAVTVLAILTATVMALRGRATGKLRDAGLLLGFLVILQFILGVTALASKSIDIGVAHQLNAVLLLGAMVYMIHILRGATR